MSVAHSTLTGWGTLPNCGSSIETATGVQFDQGGAIATVQRGGVTGPAVRLTRNRDHRVQRGKHRPAATPSVFPAVATAWTRISG